MIKVMTYADFQEIEKQFFHVSTGSKWLDKILGGGIRSAAVSDFHGLPGTGKTQLCFELMINAIMTSPNNKDDITVAYVSTKKCFMPDRIRQILNQRKKKAMNEGGSSEDQAKIDFTEHDILKRILYKQVFDFDELSYAVHSLCAMAKEQNDKRHLRMIVIDTISFHFRQLEGFDKIRSLYQMLGALSEISFYNNIAVVVTSDMTVTSSVSKTTGEQKFYYSRFLSDHYVNCLSQCIELVNIDGMIQATTIKQCVPKRGRSRFTIDEDIGIIDGSEEEEAKRICRCQLISSTPKE